MTCPNCGKALEADSGECRNCGIILSAGVLEKAAARNNGGYSEELFLKELENFIGPL